MSAEIQKSCTPVPLQVRGDERGSLVAIESGRDIPFEIARAYYVFETKAGVGRGFHAHHALTQFAIAVSGACTMVLDDGRERIEKRLDSPALGLNIPPMIWHEMIDFTPDCVLLVLADAHYDESDYIRDYDGFLEAVGARRS
jgi:dTDP-4-dehydrorhamnose 3,5-epimerase-like enzyme